jgi:hypothetical protein
MMGLLTGFHAAIIGMFVACSHQYRRAMKPLIFLAEQGIGRIAQLVEQLTLNQRVQGSSPCAPTNKIKDLTLEQKRTFGRFYNSKSKVLQLSFWSRSLCSRSLPF